MLPRSMGRPRVKLSKELHKNILYGCRDIALYCGRDIQTLRRWIRVFHFPVAILPNGHWITSRDAVTQWIMSLRTQNILDLRSVYAKMPAELRNAMIVQTHDPEPKTHAA